MPFPSNASCVVQTLWGESRRLLLVLSLTSFAGSIGWATGAALGVAVRPSHLFCALRPPLTAAPQLAATERKNPGRTILFTGTSGSRARGIAIAEFRGQAREVCR